MRSGPQEATVGLPTKLPPRSSTALQVQPLRQRCHRLLLALRAKTWVASLTKTDAGSDATTPAASQPARVGSPLLETRAEETRSFRKPRLRTSPPTSRHRPVWFSFSH